MTGNPVAQILANLGHRLDRLEHAFAGLAHHLGSVERVLAATVQNTLDLAHWRDEFVRIYAATHAATGPKVAGLAQQPAAVKPPPGTVFDGPDAASVIGMQRAEIDSLKKQIAELVSAQAAALGAAAAPKKTKSAPKKK